MFYIPTRQDIENLQVGDSAITPFGNYKEVVEITCKKEDVNGKLFVCYYTRFGGHSRISNSMKEKELVRTAETSKNFTSAELDDIEQDMIAKGETFKCL